MLLQIFFFIALPVWFLIICIWALLKLFKPDSQYYGGSVCKKVSTVFYLFITLKWLICEQDIVCKTFWSLICVVISVLFFFPMLSDLPRVFLLSSIAESVFAILIKYFSPFSDCKCPECKCPECKCPECKCPECKCMECKCPSCCGRVCKVLYLLIMGAFWGAALYVFFGEATTDKAETPEKSRNLNHNCVMFGFFDYHDLWHIFSSHALLMTAYLVMFMSHK